MSGRKTKEDSSSNVYQHMNFIDMFYEQVKNNSKSIAISSEDNEMSYEELNEKSDQLANYLTVNGVRKGQLVGLCFSTNSSFVVCMLGILKAGAGYFPLDPLYPVSRLEYMVSDANPSMILVEEKFSNLFKGRKLLEIDRNFLDKKINQKSKFIPPLIQPEDVAYVVYTSGSTGNPKGIVIAHRSLPQVAMSHSDYYPSGIKMLISGGVCFDANLLVIFHALVNNETLCIFDFTPKDSIEGLVKFIKRKKINYIISVPSNYLRLLHAGKKFPFLKCVSLTGENLPASLCKIHAKVSPNSILYNEYGPSEYAIGTTIAKIYDPKNQRLKKITVGKPLPNTHIYLLNEKLKKVRKGGKGEICIGGIGLAKEYLNNPRLTHDRFVDISLTTKSKPIRLYRTGDYGRFLPTGELEFLGRIDQIIRIGKNKINLGEIEYYISRHPDIKESAVIIQKDKKKRKNLVLYFTSIKESLSKSLVLGFLGRVLPKYMMPNLIIQVPKFSYTPNGKIDRDLLMNSYA